MGIGLPMYCAHKTLHRRQTFSANVELFCDGNTVMWFSVVSFLCIHAFEESRVFRCVELNFHYVGVELVNDGTPALQMYVRLYWPCNVQGYIWGRVFIYNCSCTNAYYTANNWSCDDRSYVTLTHGIFLMNHWFIGSINFWSLILVNISWHLWLSTGTLRKEAFCLFEFPVTVCARMIIERDLCWY